MDWQRAKTILIIAFILVNLFLLYQIQQTMHQKDEYIAIDKISDQQIQSLLKENHMKLLAPRPKDVKELKIWQGTLSPISDWQELKHGYQKKYTTNLIVINSEEQLRAFLAKEVPYFSEYHLLLRPKSIQGKWIYTQKINNHSLFDGKLEIQIEGKQISSIYITHYKLQDTPKIVDITDFNNALYSLIDYEMSNKAQVIRKVELGYRAQVYNDQTTFFIPVWRFQVDEKQYDVHATRFGSVKSVEVVKNGS
jgi:regulatory protein YycI of two-component signal transduction system YycFG